MKKIGVTGASGFIGKALVAALTARGDYVRAFVRQPDATNLKAPVDVRTLDLASARIADIAAQLEGLDAVCHLAGETVAGRWTAEKKRKIHDSRELTTRNLVTAMWECTSRPGVLVCASASGYYGSRGDEPLGENAPPGDDFLAHVCIDWEREAQVAEEFGTRVVRLRQGLVLGRDGGALAAMLPPFRFGLGGPLGSGRQWWPWIHLNDLVELWLFALDREDLSGPMNAVAPDPATSERFAQALGHALSRPSLAPAPAFALKLALGEFAQSLLASQLLLPAVAQDLEFHWQHPHLEAALLDLLDPSGRRTPRTQTFASSQLVDEDLSRVFAFFSDPANLAALTPQAMRFTIRTPLPIEMRRGVVIDYSLRVSGWPVHWKTLITRWDPPHAFEDVALRGPYLLWRHEHTFETKDAKRVELRDSVEYSLGLAPFSDVALKMVGRRLDEIFAYRRARVQALLH